MTTKGKPSAVGPFFYPVDAQGLADFWQTYDQHYLDIRRVLLDAIAKTPGIQAWVQRVSEADLEREGLEGHERLRRAVVDGNWDDWLTDLRKQGEAYASANVAFHEWFSIVAAFKRQIIPHLLERFAKEPERASAAILALTGYVDVAMSNIGGAYLRTKERIIAQQQEAIQELSTPVLPIKERLLLAPLIGVIDTQRARHLTEQLLRGVRTHRARVVVVDITGVPAVDSKVANHLLQTIAAARLMGARSIVTGLSADVAQALVALGVDIDKLNTVGDLQGGLEEADRLLKSASEVPAASSGS